MGSTQITTEGLDRGEPVAAGLGEIRGVSGRGLFMRQLQAPAGEETTN